MIGPFEWEYPTDGVPTRPLTLCEPDTVDLSLLNALDISMDFLFDIIYEPPFGFLAATPCCYYGELVVTDDIPMDFLLDIIHVHLFGFQTSTSSRYLAVYDHTLVALH